MKVIRENYNMGCYRNPMCKSSCSKKVHATKSNARAMSTLRSKEGFFPSVQPFGRPLDQLEVILNESPLDEGTLVGVHELSEMRSQPRGEDLGNQLANSVDECYGPVVFNQRCIH
jgi:hypothetical protein